MKQLSLFIRHVNIIEGIKIAILIGMMMTVATGGIVLFSTLMYLTSGISNPIIRTALLISLMLLGIAYLVSTMERIFERSDFILLAIDHWIERKRVRYMKGKPMFSVMVRQTEIRFMNHIFHDFRALLIYARDHEENRNAKTMIMQQVADDEENPS